MKETRIIMGMPITIEVVDRVAKKEAIDVVFDYFNKVDENFSPYKLTSEVTLVNKGKLKEADYSNDLNEVLKLSQKTKEETDGYFDIYRDGKLNPSGLVKGWAVLNATDMLAKRGYRHYYVEAGGDIQIHGRSNQGKKWQVGIRNPFNLTEIIKVLELTNCGIATSGTYIRGQHVYDPHRTENEIKGIVSLTVIGPDIYEADRFATAAFAMGREGIEFIERLNGFEGYMVDKKGIATQTSDFERYLA